ncbi:hypothetical protein ACP275_10G110100 [Erythranthe tilingii]
MYFRKISNKALTHHSNSLLPLPSLWSWDGICQPPLHFLPFHCSTVVWFCVESSYGTFFCINSLSSWIEMVLKKNGGFLPSETLREKILMYMAVLFEVLWRLSSFITGNPQKNLFTCIGPLV